MRKKSFSIRFYPLVKKRFERGAIPIYVRITIDRKKAELFTQCSLVDLSAWDDITQRERNNRSTVNPELSNIEAKLSTIYSELQSSGKHITSYLIKDQYLGTGSKQIKLHNYVHDFFRQHVENSTNYGKGTVRNFLGTLARFDAFLQGTNQNDLLLGNTDEAFVHQFHYYLTQVVIRGSSVRLQPNTIMKHHKRIKMIFRNAVEDGLLDRNPYSRFKITAEQGKRTYLSKDELRRIEEAKFGENPSLEKTRDIFLFSVYTGLRFNDAQQLSSQNLEFDGQKYWIDFQQQKTGASQRLPLLIKALTILRRYEELCEITGQLLPRISNQKVNTYLKVIAEIAGITKKLSHHVARHTHATTIMLANGASIEVVSRQLGHTNIRTTQIYAKITNQMLSDTVDLIEKKLG